MRPSKRHELVEKALQVFYRHGFRATGMDMLVAETGISKTSMYNHFKTKEDLILAVLELRDRQFRAWLFERMEQLATNPRDQLIAMFDAVAEWFKRPEFQGCLFIKASAEYQEMSHPIHRLSADHKRALEAQLSGLALTAGLSRPEQLARQLLLLKEGAIVAAHLGIAENPAGDAKRAAIALIDQAEAAV